MQSPTLHKKGFTSLDTEASVITPKPTICQIIKNFKVSSSIIVKKASGCLKSSRHQNRLLKVVQLWDRGSGMPAGRWEFSPGETWRTDRCRDWGEIIV